MVNIKRIKEQKQGAREIAKERILELFAQAKDATPTYANRYVQMARRISTRFNVPIPRDCKKLFCRGCGAYLKAGSTLKTRLRNRRVAYTCAACGRIQRYLLKKPVLSTAKGFSNDK